MLTTIITVMLAMSQMPVNHQNREAILPKVVKVEKLYPKIIKKK